MRPEGQKTARRRADRIAAFKAELAELALEGGLVLTPEQQSRLDDHFQSLFSRYQSEYAVELTDATKRVSWGMRVASLLGAAAFMVATILFLHRVWGSLSVPLQVLVLTAAPVALLLATELARTRGVDTYYVSLLALAAGAAFVLETSALGAVLNLHDSPHILLAWGSVGMLLAYAYRVQLILAAGLALLCSWTAGLSLHMQGFYWPAFMQASQWLIPGAAILYAVPWTTGTRHPEGFDLVYRLCGSIIGWVALLVMSTAGDLCSWVSPQSTAALYQAAGLLLAVLVIAHGLRLGSSAMVNVASVAFVVFAFVRLHSWWWGWMPKYLFFLALGCISFGLLLVFRRIRTRLVRETTL